ncbi:H-NS histone family protein [Burkholderia sp. Bp9017]|uniref:H-NS histone family protein n=1 Tax=unclassified Burkholderia TaxID=2613784 RepID=UPI000F5FE642|nr:MULTISPECIES: H-NS histone family protein [unclassified Burkholderia]RQZ31663.1 H-NS histone family protein [Burkholderia sp. Bp9017]RQZ37794.1 H-NS histone family protein [Burkholderia sp. Bp9016]
MAETKRTYSKVKAEIEALTAEAAQLRAAEIEAILTDIRAKVVEYGLTEQDVFGRKRSPRAKSTSEAKTTSVAKYRDPKSGATWSGKGRAPSWIAKARNRDRFLITE